MIWLRLSRRQPGWPMPPRFSSVGLRKHHFRRCSTRLWPCCGSSRMSTLVLASSSNFTWTSSPRTRARVNYCSSWRPIRMESSQALPVHDEIFNRDIDALRSAVRLPLHYQPHCVLRVFQAQKHATRIPHTSDSPHPSTHRPCGPASHRRTLPPCRPTAGTARL